MAKGRLLCWYNFRNELPSLVCADVTRGTHPVASLAKCHVKTRETRVKDSSGVFALVRMQAIMTMIDILLITCCQKKSDEVGWGGERLLKNYRGWLVDSFISRYKGSTDANK